jgi:hypothetical protein
VLAMLYTFFGGFGTPVTSAIEMVSGLTVDVPLVSWQAVIGFAIMFVPFMALCVMIGLMWSIRSKGTISSMAIAVVLIGSMIGLLTILTMLIMDDAKTIGPMVAAFSPISLILAAFDPAEYLCDGRHIAYENINILILSGSCIAAALFTAAAVLLHRQMTRTFMMTVRQLSGTQ